MPMSPSRPAAPPRVARAFFAALGGFLALFAVLASMASAGTYDVYACWANQYPNASWQQDNVGSEFDNGAACSVGAHPGYANWQQDYVLQTRNNVDGTGLYNQYYGHGSRISFFTPPGTAIVGVEADWTSWNGLTGFNNLITSSGGATGAQFHGINAWPGGWTRYGFWGIHAGRFDISTMCSNSPNCARPNVSTQLARNIIVRIQDDIAPSLDGVGGSLWDGSQWLSGSKSLGFHAYDNVGIKRSLAYVERTQGAGDWELVADTGENAGCNYIYKIPCPQNVNLSTTVNTASFSDGPHRILLRTVDAANNVTDGPIGQVYFNNTTPAKVDASLAASLKVAPHRGFLGATDTGWQITREIQLTWPSYNGTQYVARNQMEFCPKAATFGTGACTVVTQGGSPLNSAVGQVPVDGYGEWKARVRVQNQANTFGPWSDQVDFKYDPRTPGTADLPRNSAVEVNGWINNTTATDFPQGAQMAAGQQKLAGAAGIRGYSVTIQKPGEAAADPDNDLSDPSDINSVQGGENGSLVIADVPSGKTIVKAKAIGGNGKVAVGVATIELKADRDAPSVAISPNTPAAVHPLTVTHNITAADVDNATAGADGKSGMDAAPVADPVTNGGYIERNLDTSGVVQARGGSTGLTTTALGAHSLVYSAVDTAGNRSTLNTLGFTVDNDQDGDGIPDSLDACPNDPNTGCTDPGGQSVVVVPGPGGSNTITWDKKCDYLDVVGFCHPLAGMAAGTPNGTNASKKAKIALNLMSGKKANLPVKSAKTVYGRKMPLKGSLMNGPKPIAGAKVVIIEMIRYQKWAVIGTVKTDKKGTFAWKHKKSGPTRNWRAVYFPFAGDMDYLRSNATQQLVAAGVTMRATPKKIRNGKAVKFVGKVKGGYIPQKGVLMNLQVFRDGRWGTFRSIRASKTGSFSAKYRFKRSRPGDSYKFRALMSQQSSVPWMRGLSKQVRVSIR